LLKKKLLITALKKNKKKQKKIILIKRINLVKKWYKLFNDLIFLNLCLKKCFYFFKFFLFKLKKIKKSKRKLFKFILVYTKKNLRIKLYHISFKISLKNINPKKFNFILKTKSQKYIKRIYNYIHFKAFKIQKSRFTRKRDFYKYGIVNFYTGFHNIFHTITNLKGRLLFRSTAGLCGITKKNIRFTKRSMKAYALRMTDFYKTYRIKKVKRFKVVFKGPRKFFYRRYFLQRLSKKKSKRRKVFIRYDEEDTSKCVYSPNKRRKPKVMNIEQGVKHAFNGCRLKRKKRK
jgi:ribosomal protein S11